MALFKLLKGQEKNLPTNKTEGWAYVTTDEGNMYVDVSATKRVKIGAHADTATKATQDGNGNTISSTYLKLNGGTMTGNINFANNIGITAIMGGGSDGWGIIGTGTNDNGRLKIYVTDNGTTDWIDFEFRDYSGTTYTPLSMTGNQVLFTSNIRPTANNTYSLGTNDYKWSSMYATTFYGALSGTASNATSDSSGNNIENTYLKRSGGTMTGTINSQIIQPKTNNAYTLGSSSNRWSTLYSVNINNTGSWTWYGNQNFFLKATANNQEWSFDQCYDSTSFTGTYSQFWSSKNSVSIIRFYTDDNQVQIPSTGFMGIGGAGNASYKLKVTGNTYLTGTLYVGGASTFNSNLTVNSGGKVKVQNTTDSKNSQDSNASIAMQGGISIAKQLSAKSIRVDNNFSDKGCTIKFNNNNNCIEFVFD